MSTDQEPEEEGFWARGEYYPPDYDPLQWDVEHFSDAGGRATLRWIKFHPEHLYDEHGSPLPSFRRAGFTKDPVRRLIYIAHANATSSPPPFEPPYRTLFVTEAIAQIVNESTSKESDAERLGFLMDAALRLRSAAAYLDLNDACAALDCEIERVRLCSDSNYEPVSARGIAPATAAHIGFSLAVIMLRPETATQDEFIQAIDELVADGKVELPAGATQAESVVKAVKRLAMKDGRLPERYQGFGGFKKILLDFQKNPADFGR